MKFAKLVALFATMFLVGCGTLPKVVFVPVPSNWAYTNQPVPDCRYPSYPMWNGTRWDCITGAPFPTYFGYQNGWGIRY